MGFGPEQLRDKALLALEEAVQECRRSPPRRSFALRFALAYLWVYGSTDREPFDRFWRVIGDRKSPWSFSAANGALLAIYRTLGVERDEDLSMRLWRLQQESERSNDP
jgi:hypothetical protein